MADSKEFTGVVLVADLSGYYALTEAHGSVSAATIVTRYVEIVKGTLFPGTRLAERVGDEVVIVGDDVVSILETAIKLRDAIEREPYFLAIHAGIHVGSILKQAGQYFGTALNLASRVASYARGDQVLCTEKVVALAGNLEDMEFHDLGPIRFKNIPEPVVVFEVVSEGQEGGAKLFDPVCHMQVSQDIAPARLPFGDKTYYFCSFACAKIFTEHPDRYVGERNEDTRT
ncbi:MAG: YHS domain-containing protein [Proteobacteria bacterium]|nr:YHS domain-containing protein [Pseudomonadota bacterium]